MDKEEFASRLCNYMEDRILEICNKFGKGNVNMASLPAFWMGLEGDIETFLEENKLDVKDSRGE